MKHNLRPTMTANLPAIDPVDVFQILELAQANGTMRFGSDWLRLRGGRVVKASARPDDVLARILGGQGELSFRAVPGAPSGEQNLSLTALLLEAARLCDEVAK